MMDDTRATQVRAESQHTGRDYYAYHDSESTAKLSTTVVHALADVIGADVTDADLELQDTIDPDALDRIFAAAGEPSRTPSHLAFTVDGYQITVYSSGQIVITPPTHPTP